MIVSLLVLVENRESCELVDDGNSFDTVIIILVVIHGIQLLFIIVSYYFVLDESSAGLCLIGVGILPAVGYVCVLIHFMIVDGCDEMRIWIWADLMIYVFTVIGYFA